ncbi:MAG: NAD-binding protein, partial [Oscillospiraceae bacterium]
VGYYLTKTLIEHGHNPILIEQDKETCSFIANELDIPVICGDGTSIEVLEEAKTGSSDAIISVTGQDENNLISCQLAKKMFNIYKTVAKVNNPKNADIMRQLGVDIVISSTDNIARLLEREVDSATIKSIVSVNHGEASISEIRIPKAYKLNAKKLNEIKLPEDCVVISIDRQGKTIIPRGNTEILSEDKLLIMALDDSVHLVKNALKLEW